MSIATASFSRACLLRKGNPWRVFDSMLFTAWLIWNPRHTFIAQWSQPLRGELRKVQMFATLRLKKHTLRQLEMLTCDADQLQKGLWDLGCAGPLDTKDSRKLGTYHSWHQYRAIFWVKGSMFQKKNWYWDFQQEERWVYSSHICGLRL